jgi:hypothetical protein
LPLATIAGQDIELTVSGIGLVGLALTCGRRRRFSHVSGASRDGDAEVGLAPRGD